MSIDPNDGPKLDARLKAWIARGNDRRDAALVANVLSSGKSLGDVMSRLVGKQKFCPPPPGFTVQAIAGAFHNVNDHINVTVVGFSLTNSSNPGHALIRIV